jgi:DinB superfamily
MSTLAAGDAPSVRALLRWQFQRAHALLDAATGRLTPEVAHWRPPGAAAPAGACYAQAVVCEDLSVNGVLAAGTPLAFSTWAGRSGLSELPPLPNAADWHAWAQRVRLDLTELHPYARAVYAATDAYLATLPDDTLAPVRGEQPACLLSALLLTLAMRRGEIACLLALERRPTDDMKI